MFVSVEMLRTLRVAPVAAAVDRLMAPLADSRDSGPLLLSHLALLVGVAAPLWLRGREHHHRHTDVGALLWPFAGLLSVGIGDSAASLVGVYLGRRKLVPGTAKSVEGTAGGFGKATEHKQHTVDIVVAVGRVPTCKPLCWT